MDEVFTRRGFLPEPDPLPHFPPRSELAVLDQIGRDLPSRLHDHGFRSYARALVIPPWQAMGDEAEDLRALRLYYLRVGFLASGYVNQVGEAPATVLPHNLALPLCEACDRLARPPILSYDGYALYNWRRRDPTRPIALGNIDTLQNFVHLDDEHWFILVHVEIEAIAAAILAAIADVYVALDATGDADVDTALTTITDALHRQTAVLRRIPEKMDPALYYRTFRPYIRFFEDVTYEGVARSPMDYRGESGAQSSVIPAVVALRDHFDRIIIDSPPVLLVSDMIAGASMISPDGRAPTRTSTVMLARRRVA